MFDVCGSPILAEVLADWDAASADRDALARTLVIELLAWQFASPVRWIETFELMCTPVELGGLGVERIVEIGVGSAPTLANLSRAPWPCRPTAGTRPEVLNVEMDADVVFDTSEDPAPAVVVDEPVVDLTADAPAPLAPIPAPFAPGPVRRGRRPAGRPRHGGGRPARPARRACASTSSSTTRSSRWSTAPPAGATRS